MSCDQYVDDTTDDEDNFVMDQPFLWVGSGQSPDINGISFEGVIVDLVVNLPNSDVHGEFCYTDDTSVGFAVIYQWKGLWLLEASIVSIIDTQREHTIRVASNVSDLLTYGCNNAERTYLLRAIYEQNIKLE
jgi:hypothetical protein